jgi:hypothetical protein
MGQQQLILLVLATVIVGLAIVVGIAAFSENSNKANADAMMQDAVRMANDAQALLKKPAAFGGVSSFEDVSFAKMGYANVDANNDGEPLTVYTNLNGQFELTQTATSLLIRGFGGDGVIQEVRDAQGNITAVNFIEDNVRQEVAVIVCGPTETNIKSAIMKIGGATVTTAPPEC